MMLDTNALSAWADGNPGCLASLTAAPRFVIPVIVLGEYRFGIRQSTHRALYESWLTTYLPTVEISDVTSETAETYAGLRLDLKQRGTPIPANDLWIAALAFNTAYPCSAMTPTSITSPPFAASLSEAGLHSQHMRKQGTRACHRATWRNPATNS